MFLYFRGLIKVDIDFVVSQTLIKGGGHNSSFKHSCEIELNKQK